MGMSQDIIMKKFSSILADEAPEAINFPYRTRTGEVRYRTYYRGPSAEDVRADSNTHDGTPAQEVEKADDVGIAPELNTEYKRILEYREINRHARRKIEAWLSDGWCVSWKWNGSYDYEDHDSRRKYRDERYTSAHWMTLVRKEETIPSPHSKKRIELEFPSTPEPPLDPNPHWREQQWL